MVIFLPVVCSGFYLVQRFAQQGATPRWATAPCACLKTSDDATISSGSRGSCCSSIWHNASNCDRVHRRVQISPFSSNRSQQEVASLMEPGANTKSAIARRNGPRDDASRVDPQTQGRIEQRNSIFKPRNFPQQPQAASNTRARVPSSREVFKTDPLPLPLQTSTQRLFSGSFCFHTSLPSSRT